jgi:hypothetical protein
VVTSNDTEWLSGLLQHVGMVARRGSGG